MPKRGYQGKRWLLPPLLKERRKSYERKICQIYPEADPDGGRYDFLRHHDYVLGYAGNPGRTFPFREVSFPGSPCPAQQALRARPSCRSAVPELPQEFPDLEL